MTRASRPPMTKKVPAETPYRMPMRLWSTVVNQLHRPRYAGSAIVGGATTMPPTRESGALTTAIRSVAPRRSRQSIDRYRRRHVGFVAVEGPTQPMQPTNSGCIQTFKGYHVVRGNGSTSLCESPFELSDGSFHHLTPPDTQRGGLFAINPSR